MSQDPRQPAPRKGIILPGEVGPAPADKAVLPADAPGASTKARVILPPGAAEEVPDDLPEYPRLRPLEIHLTRVQDQDLIVLSDPTGVVEDAVALSAEALPVLQFLDGTVSLNEACSLVVRRSGDVRAATLLRQFLGQLDRLLLLDSPRYREAAAGLQREYHRLEFRQAALAGLSYPDSAEELRRELDRHFERAQRSQRAAGEPEAGRAAVPRALVVPHIDVRRGGSVIARAYLELGPEPPADVRFVLIGTGHQLVDDHFALTRKHFETPFGPARCDTRFVDALATRLGDAAFEAELAHRDEHSIEFQTLYLKHRLGDRPFTIVPILFGGFHALVEEVSSPREEPAVEGFIAALREVAATQGGTTCFVAAVDLSHVGARFGDRDALDERKLQEIERLDRDALEAACRGDAEAWYRSIAAHGDSTRICGYGPVYALLRCLEPGEGRLMRYEQSLEANGSVVSFAAMTWS
jgi:AmmeMemoRadiSam system protein B